MEFNAYMQHYLKKDHDELVTIAKNAIKNLHPVCAAVDTANDGFFLLTAIVTCAISADGTLTKKERTFLQEVLNVNDEAITRYTKMYNSDIIELIDSFADSINDEVKMHVVHLALSIMCADDEISKEETALIRKLLD